MRRFLLHSLHSLPVVPAALALALVPSTHGASPSASGADPAAALLLARARAHHYTGDFAADVVCIRESFLRGRDTLTGLFEVRPSAGERRLVLRGGGETFEWWSRLDGEEQWRREGAHGRLRRLPPHSYRKPAFAPDVSYEDLARLPFGHLDGFRTARRGGDGDVTSDVDLVPDSRRSLYGSLVASFTRDPLRLRRVTFVGEGTRPSKTMTLDSYVPVSGGGLPTVIVFEGEEGVSSVTLRLTPRGAEPPRDKALADEEPSGRGFADPQWQSRDGAGSSDDGR